MQAITLDIAMVCYKMHPYVALYKRPAVTITVAVMLSIHEESQEHR